MTDITDCAGYRSLRAAVNKDYATDANFQKGGRPFHDYEAKLKWAVDRATHYGEALGLDPRAILDAWEAGRTYWYMNYYQNVRQPLISSPNVRVFETSDDLRLSIDGRGFRCPCCNGVSKDAYACDTGALRDGKPCDWKAYGLFGTLGKGSFVYVKEKLAGAEIFMPVAWEPAPVEGEAVC